LKIIVAISEYASTEPTLSIAMIDEACSSYFVDDLPMPTGLRERSTSIPSLAMNALATNAF
jgi:hypothetical protein